MNAREHMERHAHLIAGWGLAWERSVFIGAPSLQPVELVDAAVDIAWDRLMPADAPERPALTVYNLRGMIVFSVYTQALEYLR